VDTELPKDDLMPPLDDPAIELGAIYRSSAVRAEHDPERQLDDPKARAWTVGARVPHIPLAEPRGHRSTLDAADAGFAVLADGALDAWRHAAAEVEKSLGVPVAVTAVDPTASAPGPTDWTGAVLIRPDAVVAWKPAAPAGAAADRLVEVVAGLLSVGGR
jgi:hypothetical protein